MSTIDERLRGLDIALPDVMPPVVDGYVRAFAPFVRSGDQIHLSGRLGKKDGKPLFGPDELRSESPRQWHPGKPNGQVCGRSRGIQDAGISGRMPLWRARNNLSHQHRSHVLAPAARRLFVLSAAWGGWDIGPGGQSLHRHRESLQGSVLSFRTSDRGFLDLR